MKKGQKKNGLVKGAATIAAGGLIAKLIGAAYRIPLTNLIGGEGIGLYQLVYPFYCLLLTVSATGIPSSIATLTAKKQAAGEDVGGLVKTCRRLFLGLGLAATVLMVAVAPYLARAQGEPKLFWGYLALSPSVFLVSGIAVYRGYFQGLNQMFPTACSEVIEQVVKVAVGLAVAWAYRADVYRVVVALLFAVTVSEVVALIFLKIRFQRVPAPVKTLKNGAKTGVKGVLKLTVPVTLSACLLPLFGLVDSVLIVRLLGNYTDRAVALYGLFAGGAVTVVNLPVSVCYGIAAASVPALSSTVQKGGSGRKQLRYSLLLTLGISTVAAVGLYTFSEQAVGVLFRALSQEDRSVLTGLIQRFSISAITLSCTQTLAACLTAVERPNRAALSMLLAMLVKTALNVVFVGDSVYSIYGAAIAANVGYALSFALNLWFALRATKVRKRGKGRSWGKLA